MNVYIYPIALRAYPATVPGNNTFGTWTTMVSLCSFVPILAFWLWHCRLVKAQREVLAGEVRLTSAVLLRLCGQICVVCVPHCIVVFFVLVQTSETTGRFYMQVFVYLMLLRAAVCGMAYTRECVKPGHACFALYFLSLEELARKGYYTQFVRSCDFLCFISRSVKA